VDKRVAIDNDESETAKIPTTVAPYKRASRN